MNRLQIPYERVIVDPTDFDPASFDGLLVKLLEESRRTPLLLEVFNEQAQFFVFVREGQFYWAACSREGGFEGLSMREFFTRLGSLQFPRLVAYQVSLLLYHSLIVYMQKKPELRISSSLVDLDELLDRTGEEHGNSLVTAFQPGNLVMLRYKEGRPVSTYHGLRIRKAAGPDPREEFLVKVYTMSARMPFEINLFSDLKVTHSEDAREIPADHRGSIASFFLSQPPKLVVRLKDRPLKTYTFTGKHLTIGRLPDNDIVIDNLGVSRKHAVIHVWKSGYLLKDLGSKNSTLLNGKRIDSAELRSGDVITIGKYQISFQVPVADPRNRPALDQTVIIPRFSAGAGTAAGGRAAPGPARPPTAAAGAPRESARAGTLTVLEPRLYRRSDHEEYPLGEEGNVISRRKGSWIRLEGLFAPRVEIEISRSGEDFVVRKVSGRSDMSINGEVMAEKVLEEEDLISVGGEEFVFKM